MTTDAMSDGDAANSRRVVARNALIMMLAQILGMPLSMLTNILMGRHLGPEEYGQYYLLTTFATLAFLFVDWGLGTIMPARIATDRAGAGRYLGSVMSWTLCGSVLALGVMTAIFYWRGATRTFLAGLSLVCLGQALALLVRNATDAVRGFERSGLSAYAQLGTQLLTAVLVIPALFWWGTLLACLVGIALASLLMLAWVWRSLRGVGIDHLQFDATTLRDLLGTGTSFLVLNLVLYLTPAVDAYFLRQFASEQAIGWLAAARKLINPLLFPATAMISALYPTLCRLWTQNTHDYCQTAQATLRIAIIITVPLATGCALFANVGILLFSAQAYGPAIDNLRILAGFVLLLYVTMIVGTCINAAGRQRSWSMVQSVALVVSLVADPLLIPWFQAHFGNGGLGVNIVNIASETFMLLAGFWLLPRGILDRSILLCLARALTAGAAMAACAWLVSGVTEWISVPLAGFCYAAILYMIGGVQPQQLQMLRSMLKRSH
ncbi:MAG: flippase [Steroidobacteraceae bacterium]